MTRTAPIAIVVALLAVGGIAYAVVSAQGDDAADPAVPTFVDDTTTSGLDHRYDGGFEFFVGGGVAAFDCDTDGRPDLYFAGGSEPAALFRNESAIGGELQFTRITSSVTDLASVTGAYPIDIDSDDVIDLVVLRGGSDVILRGLGDCEFEQANERFGIDDGDTRTVGFSATWEGVDSLPTMAFGDYLAADGQTCEDSRLVRPTEEGAGYANPVALTPGYCTLSVLFSDWQRTGRRDLRMTNDRHYYRVGSEQLWRIDAGDAPTEYTEADGWRPLRIWGMGIASQDLTGDGKPEVFLTSQADNKLQTLVDGAAGPTYEDIALELGVTAHRPFAGGDVLPSTAWHPEFQDLNNDGLFDLFITKGNVEEQPGYAQLDPSNLLLGQPDGTFVEAAEAAGILAYHRARGAAVVDLNADGMLDIVVVNRAENVTAWRNVGSGDADGPIPIGGSASVRLHQQAPNVDAIGSWVEVRVGDRTVTREVTIGGGHAGGQLGWLHVGLGDEDRAEIRVQWPDGELGPWMELGPGDWVTIDRGAGTPVPSVPKEDS